MQFLIEFLPLIIFLGVLLTKDIYAAVAVLMIAMPIAFGIKYLMTRKIDKMYFWSTVLAIVFGALTLYFKNPDFVKWKPTALVWAAAVVFLVSQFVSERPLVQKFLEMVDDVGFEKVSDVHWRRLNMAWVFFFLIVGILNLYVAFNFDIETWGKFKVFGLMGLQFLFLLAQIVWLMRLIGPEEEED